MVFDIQRSALLDGPGIRTAVFVKGCPLRCIWCHNPESQLTQPQIMLYAERCVGCGACACVCEQNCHELLVQNAHLLHTENCVSCGKCVAACPYNAIDMKGSEQSVEEVFSIIIKDKAFYDASGGGVTISGGEPLAAYNRAFTMHLLSKCKDAGIHTCVETCGFISSDEFQKFFPLVDLFLFDYKATGSDMHKRLTGVDNTLILDNLNMAYSSGKQIVLRCPMVPGVNDTPEHLDAIAALDKKYPNLKGIEIMAYHNMGVAKHERLGTIAKCDLPNTDEEKKSQWLTYLHEKGCKKAIIG